MSVHLLLGSVQEMPRSAAVGRALSGVLAAVLVVGLLFAVLISPARASVETVTAELVNEARADAGAEPLSHHAGLSTVAAGWAERMAREGAMWHNPNVADEIPSGWTSWAENVAYSSDPTAAVLHGLLMNSSSHRANILDRRFTHIGIGFATDSRGYGYMAQVFATYPSTSPEPPRTPRPRPRPQPEQEKPEPEAPATTRPQEDDRPAPRPSPGPSPSPGPAPASSPQPGDELPSGWLGPGADPEAVTELQRDLVTLGWSGVADDGDYGPVTTAAVLELQARHGLLTDGLVGPATQAVLRSELDAAGPVDDDDDDDAPVREPEEAPSRVPRRPALTVQAAAHSDEDDVTALVLPVRPPAGSVPWQGLTAGGLVLGGGYAAAVGSWRRRTMLAEMATEARRRRDAVLATVYGT